MKEETSENKEQDVKKPLSVLRTLWRATTLLLLSGLEQLVYTAVIMYHSILPAFLAWGFLELSGLVSVRYFLVWIGISAVAAIYKVLNK